MRVANLDWTRPALRARAAFVTPVAFTMRRRSAVHRDQDRKVGKRDRGDFSQSGRRARRAARDFEDDARCRQDIDCGASQTQAHGRSPIMLTRPETSAIG
jgi:hypothetical protein